MQAGHGETAVGFSLGWIGMKPGRNLHLDPAKEALIGDDEAKAMRSRPQRAPSGNIRLLKKG